MKLRKLTLLSSIILGFLFFNTSYSQLKIGDPGVRFDNSKNDPNYPFMNNWRQAGVEGGIPRRSSSPVIRTLSPTNSQGLQNAINAVNPSRPSVILLRPGTYNINRSVLLKSNVILRGMDKQRVKFNVSVRSNGSRDTPTIRLVNTRKTGLEDITFEYIPPSGSNITLYDDRNVPLNRFCGNRCFSSDPGGVRNMHVSFVRITDNSKNCWVDNCVFRNAGGDPLEIFGDHNTFRNNFVDACFNRGANGTGYYDIRGNNNLISNERVRRIRHFGIQNGAKYNVVINCDLEVDVNFHNGDGGFNLIEKNKITSLRWRSWGAFASGSARFGHRRPGNNNIIFNNTTAGRNNSERFGGNTKVFVFDQFSEPRVLRNSPPRGRTFYPAILNEPGNTPPPTTNNQLIANGTYFINSPVSSDRLVDTATDNNNVRSQINSSNNRNKWIFNHLGDNVYSIKNSGTNRFLEVPFARCENGSNVATWTGASSNHQKWKVTKNNSHYFLRPNHCRQRALDRSRGQTNTNAHIWRFNTSQANQRWEIRRTSSAKVLTNSVLQIFPNPVSSNLIASGIDRGSLIVITNTSGKVLKSTIATSNETKISVANFSKGLYFITINNKTAKFIKE